MLRGKSFRLKIQTLGIETASEGRRSSIQVPAGSIVTVVCGPTEYDHRMIEVTWAGHTLVMFLEDVEGRGELVQEPAGQGRLPEHASAGHPS